MPSGSLSHSFSNKPIAYIHLNNIQANLNLAREKSLGCKMMAVIKANAYGHGVELVAAGLTGMDAFAVARVEEGLVLRSLGVEIPIYVLQGFLGKAELEICLETDLIPMIHTVDQWQLVNSIDVELPVWLKFDTGMHRLGLSESELDLILANPGGLSIVGIASHFANADIADHDENIKQLSVFGAKTNNLFIHKSMANSGAVLGLSSSHYDWVRPGIMLYGGSTSGRHDPTLKPGMTLTAPVIAVRSLAAGESIGYGSTWATEVATRIAIVGIGYADGYPRELPSGTPVLINGKRCEIVGRVSMDMIMVEIPFNLQARSGDRAILWGDKLFIDDVASHIGTLGYTLMAGLTGRVARVVSPMTPAQLVAGGAV